MLKIKDEIDLEKLEKLGFRKEERVECYETKCYFFHNKKENSNVYIPLEEIYFGKHLRFAKRQIIMDGIEYDLFEVPEIIYDLIKADMVEKVEE